MIWPLFYSVSRTNPPLRWSSVEVNQDPVRLLVPQYGTHLVLEMQVLNEQVATAVNFPVYVNDDLDFTKYHFQRYIASNNAAAATEGTTANGVQVAGISVPANDWSQVQFIFPHFRVSARQKVWYALWTIEEVELNQQIGLVIQKRTSATTGSIDDAIASLTFDNATDTVTDGTIRMAVTP